MASRVTFARQFSARRRSPTICGGRSISSAFGGSDHRRAGGGPNLVFRTFVATASALPHVAFFQGSLSRYILRITSLKGSRNAFVGTGVRRTKRQSPCESRAVCWMDRAIKNYRFRLSGCGLSRSKSWAAPETETLLAHSLGSSQRMAPDSARIRATVSKAISGQLPSKGGSCRAATLASRCDRPRPQPPHADCRGQDCRSTEQSSAHNLRGD